MASTTWRRLTLAGMGSQWLEHNECLKDLGLALLSCIYLQDPDAWRSFPAKAQYCAAALPL